MKLIRSGGTRWVVLTKNHAIKFPIPTTWKRFIQGLLSNITEGQWKGMDKKYLCPIVYTNRFGLLVIMKRCEPVRHEGLFWVELESLYSECELGRNFYEYDAFPKNFGYYKGRLVKIDYGV